MWSGVVPNMTLTRGNGRQSGDTLIHLLARGEAGPAAAHGVTTAGKAASQLGAGGGRQRQLGRTGLKAAGTWAGSKEKRCKPKGVG
jgi:hypothetical protein